MSNYRSRAPKAYLSIYPSRLGPSYLWTNWALTFKCTYRKNNYQNMITNWSFAKITDILLKMEVCDRISKSLSQQNFRCPSPYFPKTVMWEWEEKKWFFISLMFYTHFYEVKCFRRTLIYTWWSWKDFDMFNMLA